MKRAMTRKRNKPEENDIKVKLVFFKKISFEMP